MRSLKLNLISKFIGFDNPNTYYSFNDLWKEVPNDYKKYNQLKCVTLDNIDETLHPNDKGNKIWDFYME